MVIIAFILMRKYDKCTTLKKILRKGFGIFKDKKILNRLNRAIKEFKKY